jgi:hexokinase
VLSEDSEECYYICELAAAAAAAAATISAAVAAAAAMSCNLSTG